MTTCGEFNASSFAFSREDNSLGPNSRFDRRFDTFSELSRAEGIGCNEKLLKEISVFWSLRDFALDIVEAAEDIVDAAEEGEFDL